MQQNPQNPMGAPGGVPGPGVPGGGMPRMDQPNMGMGGPQQGPSQGPQVRDILPLFSMTRCSKNPQNCIGAPGDVPGGGMPRMD